MDQPSVVQREGVGRGPSHHAGSRVRQEHGGPDWHHMVEISERVVPGRIEDVFFDSAV